MSGQLTGPLAGLKVVELAGLGPAPFCAMLLADLGADVTCVDRAAWVGTSEPMDVLRRGRRSIAVDLKHDRAAETVLRLVERADVFLEGFRPGVAERLGVGPQPCRDRNPALIYGRMTGWGQDGPLASVAGHDINYIAVAGALQPIGRAGEPPVPPLNLLGDFGGGGMLLALGVLAALQERAVSGLGQVVDAAMVDGASLLLTMLHDQRHIGMWSERRADNYIDTAAPYYDTYETSDGQYVAVGAIEPQFWSELLRLLDLDPAELPDQEDKDKWPAMKRRFADIFASRTRDAWCEIFDGADACVTPVLAPNEVAAYPHMAARRAMITVGDRVLPAPAPRFSRSYPAHPSQPPRPGQHSVHVLAGAGFSEDEINDLLSSGAVAGDDGGSPAHIRNTP
ncbi:CaiB/BaiF CoA transferase family protein [Mycolicibacterium holsaticum]|jgi:alpha-methylacyl-CoA racemase|uniref:CaiB/BaiF CoA transferase family protein n=1 Tax=Mycolicibacterium holsaticum TaxID=152142 RepID=UPI001C7D070C|nr:CaiB/BaiF CoA-transferase family protein [Mycolicibacterium holsaticum]MDA4105774.1 carnitine dehydratase [Mycolicibacterium holsaticum DSM 44478 = JCM 12374]QZA13861.1 CoA transferase [Mycolicibacterium holsaticum DSM 44478 = JCM 12374]UNC08680.1 CoA transferase [Mycolicibacterium holsaticum DSM 44478 = JCM 12374]